MGELITRTEKEYSVKEWLRSSKFHSQLQVASPMDMQGSRLARIALSLIVDKPALAECDKESLLSSVMVCAQTGLEPGPVGHAAIVPYKQKAQWQAMFRGMLHLVHRSEQVASVSTGVVRELDEFDYDEGSTPFVHFKRPLLPDADRGERVAAFCTINPKEGVPYVRVMHISEIESIRDRYSKGRREDRPWISEFDEMARKTVIKRVAKLAPVSLQAKIALTYDDLQEIGKDQPSALPPDFDAERTPDSYCNKELEDGIVCSLDVDHVGDCVG